MINPRWSWSTHGNFFSFHCPCDIKIFYHSHPLKLLFWMNRIWCGQINFTSNWLSRNKQKQILWSWKFNFSKKNSRAGDSLTTTRGSSRLLNSIKAACMYIKALPYVNFITKLVKKREEKEIPHRYSPWILKSISYAEWIIRIKRNIFRASRVLLTNWDAHRIEYEDALRIFLFLKEQRSRSNLWRCYEWLWINIDWVWG